MNVIDIHKAASRDKKKVKRDIKNLAKKHPEFLDLDIKQDLTQIQIAVLEMMWQVSTLPDRVVDLEDNVDVLNSKVDSLEKKVDYLMGKDKENEKTILSLQKEDSKQVTQLQVKISEQQHQIQHNQELSQYHFKNSVTNHNLYEQEKDKNKQRVNSGQVNTGRSSYKPTSINLKNSKDYGKF